MEGRALASIEAGPSGRLIGQPSELTQYFRSSESKGSNRRAKPCRVQAAATTVAPGVVTSPALPLEVLTGYAILLQSLPLPVGKVGLLVSLSRLSAVPCHEIGLSSTVYCCRDWETAYKELEMQRGYCSVATRYSPGLVRQQAFSSPEASLKVVCGSSSLVGLGL